MSIKFGKHTLIALCLISISYTAFAQRGRGGIVAGEVPHSTFIKPNGRPFNNNKQPPLRKIQVIKEQYISKQLALSPDQTYKFLATYRRYLQEAGAVRVLKRLNNSDAQANGVDQVNKDIAYERELVNIKERYKDEFLKIMPPEKVSQIFKSETQFNDEVYRQLKERKANGPAPVPVIGNNQ